MLRRAPNFTVGNWGSTNAGFTLRTGLAELIYLHPFGPFRFADMLLSPSGFPSRLAGCPRRCLRSRPPAPGGQSHVRRNGAPQQSGWHHQGLEAEIQNLVTREYQAETLEDSDKQKISASYSIDMLAEHINLEDAEAIMQMRDLRNRIVHGEVSPEEVTEDKAREYVQKAIFLAHEISQSVQIPEE